MGRGTTVDSDALVEALRSGKIFWRGPRRHRPGASACRHPLWGEPGAIITPHNSGKFSLPKTLDNIVDIFIHNLKRYAEGLPLDNQVDRTTRYAADQNGGHRLLSSPVKYDSVIKSPSAPRCRGAFGLEIHRANTTERVTSLASGERSKLPPSCAVRQIV